MRILIMVPVLLAATLAGAKTFWIKNGTTDWTQAESYFDEDQHSAVAAPPGAGDLVAIPSGSTTVYLDASDISSWSLVNSLAQIAPRGTSSKLVITVAEGTATLSVPVTIYDTLLPGMSSTYTTTAWQYGTIVKKGAGALAMACVGTKRPLPTSNSCYDYFAGLDVQAGSLYFPQSTPGRYSCYFGRVSVAEGATLFTCKNESDNVSYAATYVKSLSGAGVVTNTFETGYSAANSKQYYFGVNGTEETDAVFSGKIGGAIRAIVAGVLNMSGTESTAYGSSTLNGGEWTVSSIGLKGGPSSLGAGNWLYVREAGGTLRYAGEGETVSRQLGFSPSTAPFVIDAGPVGGLDFTGKWDNGYSSTRPAQMRNLVLTGSNTVPCTVDVEMETDSLYLQGTNFTCYMTKEGSGTWRFKDCATHVNDNGFWVKEGTLQFDSIDEAGTVCALGTATNLTDGYIGNFDPSRARDYAFKLGGLAKSGAANEATFEFTGTNRSWCGSRPFVLAGDARIKNDTDRPLRLCSLSALAGVTPTVTFCGSGTAGNEFYDIADGASPVSVRKTGTGSWTLGGDLSFSGALSVDEGTLTVRKSGKYDWFRWTLKEEQGETYARFRIEEFGLFAEGTNRLTSSMLCLDDGELIRPGQAAIRAALPMKFVSSTTSGVSYDGTLTHMLENAKHNGMQATVLRDGNETHSSVDDPETWIPVLIRLPEDAPEVVSFDYVNLYGSGNANSVTAVKAYSLEGSVDGFHWDELYATNDAPLATGSWRWTKSNAQFNTGESRASTSGYPIRGHSLRTFDTLSHVSEISVSGGATLQVAGLADGETIPLKDGVTLTVDCGKATGTAVISGVSFPASGTLHVENCSRGPGVSLSIDTTASDGFENVANWEVTGLPDGYRAIVTPTGITIVPSGFVIIFK